MTYVYKSGLSPEEIQAQRDADDARATRRAPMPPFTPGISDEVKAQNCRDCTSYKACKGSGLCTGFRAEK